MRKLILFSALTIVFCSEIAITEESTESISPVVQKALAKKQELLATVLAKPAIIDAVSEANDKNALRSAEEIEKFDQDWIHAKGTGELVKPYITGPCAVELMSFQDNNDGFVEVFVTDKHGLNVCQTNKTSDFMQADEDWWIGTFNGGKGNVRYGKLEYDESAEAESISIYRPVIEPKTGAVIGVAKAVLDVSAVRRSLN